MATPPHSVPLTSEIVNYLVYRYLQESGFAHTAFTFGYESSVCKTSLDPNGVPPGSLITFIQKGLQYLELEANIDAQDGEVDGEYKMLTPEELIANDIEQLRLIVQDRKEESEAAPRQAKASDRRTKDKTERKREREEAAAAAAAGAAGTSGGAVSDKDKEKEKEKKGKDAVGPSDEKPMRDTKPSVKPAPPLAPAPAPPPQQAASAGPTPMDEDMPSAQSVEVPESSVLTLEGHDSEVYICSWSPVDPLLASGSGDSTARIWNINNSASDYGQCIVLPHQVKADKGKDVTTLDWNQDGSLLATGSYDGLARIWSKDGKLKMTLEKHQGPIFALKWNKKGDLLLSGSIDKTAVVWDAKAGEVKQVYQLHEAPTLDVDWRNNLQFATCSTDKLIHVCKVGEPQPLKTFKGHEDEVNAIKWDPSGRFLASCSDDRTAKVWSLGSDQAVHDFCEHTREIYTIKWSPTGPMSANPNLPLLLASASFDHTVRLWDVDVGRCVRSLVKHTDPVYSVAFSPNGKFVATGSFDKYLHVWAVEDGALVKTFRGEAGIYEVCWNKEGNKVAACFANRTVCVVDLRL